MLHAFLTANRAEIIARSRTGAAPGSTSRLSDPELDDGIPLFLDQLVLELRCATGGTKAIGASAALHGGALLERGFAVAQVVQVYGDVCQAVTALADEVHAPITAGEFQAFSRCLDHAIAAAVTEHARRRARTQSAEEMARLGAIAHALQDELGPAAVAYAALQSGSGGILGSAGAALDRSLRGLQRLIDRVLGEVRVESGTRDRGSVSARAEETGRDAVRKRTSRGVRRRAEPV